MEGEEVNFMRRLRWRYTGSLGGWGWREKTHEGWEGMEEIMKGEKRDERFTARVSQDIWVTSTLKKASGTKSKTKSTKGVILWERCILKITIWGGHSKPRY